MIAVPIGPRIQRFATAAAPAYLDRRGRPAHPRELLGHACLRGRFASGRCRRGSSSATARSCASTRRDRCWCGSAAAIGTAVDAAVAGVGIIHHVRRLAAPASRQRRARAGARSLVAEFFGAVPLLSRPPPGARAAAGVRRLHQGVARHRLSRQVPCAGFALAPLFADAAPSPLRRAARPALGRTARARRAGVGADAARRHSRARRPARRRDGRLSAVRRPRRRRRLFRPRHRRGAGARRGAGGQGRIRRRPVGRI